MLKETTITNQLTELKTTKLKIKNLRGYPSIDQTQRNNIRRNLLDGLYEYLYANFDEANIAAVYNTEDGIAIEVENKDVVAGFPEGNGVVTILLNLSIPNLAYDSMEALRPNDRAFLEATQDTH